MRNSELGTVPDAPEGESDLLAGGAGRSQGMNGTGIATTA